MRHHLIASCVAVMLAGPAFGAGLDTGWEDEPEDYNPCDEAVMPFDQYSAMVDGGSDPVEIYRLYRLTMANLCGPAPAAPRYDDATLRQFVFGGTGVIWACGDLYDYCGGWYDDDDDDDDNPPGPPVNPPPPSCCTPPPPPPAPVPVPASFGLLFSAAVILLLTRKKRKDR